MRTRLHVVVIANEPLFGRVYIDAHARSHSILYRRVQSKWYELSVHKPDYLTAQNLTKVLGVSAAFLYTPEDEIASLVFRYGKASKAQRPAVQGLSSQPSPSVE